MVQVFISYVRENNDIVDRLAAELSRRGATVWLDRNDIGVGARWKDEIRKAIRSGDFFLACFSREYNERQKTYMNEELVLAIEALREMPTERAWFIPVLINAGRIPDRRISSIESLSDLNAVDLSDDWDGGIQRILRTIGLADPLLSRALFLVNVARHFGTPECRQAVQDLGELGIHDRRVLSALIEATTSRADPETNGTAVRSLVALGGRAVPLVAAALQPAEDLSRQHLLTALRRIGPDAAPAAPQVIALLEEKHGPLDETTWHSTVQERALTTLAAFGPAAEPAVEILRKLLSDDERRLRTLAALVLAKIGSRKSITALRQALRDPETQKDAAGGIVWAKFGERPGQIRGLVKKIGVAIALSGIVKTLEGDNSTTRNITDAAIELLGEVGPDAAAALPALKSIRKEVSDQASVDTAIGRIQRPRGTQPAAPRRKEKPARRQPTTGKGRPGSL